MLNISGSQARQQQSPTMQLWIALALSVAVFAAHAVGSPRPTRDSGELESTSADGSLVDTKGTDIASQKMIPKDDSDIDPELKKRISRDSQGLTGGLDEGRVERALDKSATSLSSSEAMPSLKVTMPEDSKLSTPLTEGDDSIRSKKSTSARDNPHLTTVCIQVRSDHPSVVCGPQVEEDKTQKTIPAARSSLAENDMYYRQQLFSRASQGLNPGTSQFRFVQQDMPPKTVPSTLNIPSPAKGPIGFQVMRSEEQPIEAHPSSGTPSQPGRGIPQVMPTGSLVPGLPGANSVNVHKNLYPPVPMAYPAGVISPFGLSGLRLNCLSDYPMFRSTASPQPQFVQIGDQIMAVQERPSARMAQDSFIVNSPDLYLAPSHARAAHPDLPFGYSADPLVGTAFIADDGQAYFIDDSQSRAAVDNQVLLRQILEEQNKQREPPAT